MTSERSEVGRFLDAELPGAVCVPIASGASTRRFFRVTTPDGSTRVLVDYGQPFQGETDDVRLGKIFRRAGLRVADLLDVSPEAGCLLLEDLGDTSLESALADAGGTTDAARRLLERAVTLAARVADRGTPILADSDRRDGPALDAERFRFEMDYFLEHYVAGLHGCPTPPGGLRDALHGLADLAAETPRRVLCHRDFHSRNLMLPPDGGMAMVDIQDARWGPDSYDLASLLRDAYIDVEPGWIEPLIDHYRSSLGDPPAAGFRERLRRVSVQRLIKALGTFGFQATVRRETHYAGAVARSVERLRRLLPDLAEPAGLHGLMLDTGLLQAFT